MTVVQNCYDRKSQRHTKLLLVNDGFIDSTKNIATFYDLIKFNLIAQQQPHL